MAFCCFHNWTWLGPASFIKSWPWKVAKLREELGCGKDDAATQVDAFGLKVLFNHGIRRFLTGSKNRVPQMKEEHQALYFFVVGHGSNLNFFS